MVGSPTDEASVKLCLPGPSHYFHCSALAWRVRLEATPEADEIVTSSKFFGWTKFEARVRAQEVAVLASDFGDGLCVTSCPELLEPHTFAAQPIAEALIGATLRRLATIDPGDSEGLLEPPFQGQLADELRAVIRAQVGRCTAFAAQARQHQHGSPGANAAREVDCTRRAGELVCERQVLELLTAGAGIEDEVVSPGAVRPEARRGSRT